MNKYQLVNLDSVKLPKGYIEQEISFKEALLYLKAISAPKASVTKLREIELLRIEDELEDIVLKSWYTEKDGKVQPATEWNSTLRKEFAEGGSQATTLESGRTFYEVQDDQTYNTAVSQYGYGANDAPSSWATTDGKTYKTNTQRTSKLEGKNKAPKAPRNFEKSKDVPINVTSDPDNDNIINVTYNGTDGVRGIAHKVLMLCAMFKDKNAVDNMIKLMDNPEGDISIPIIIPDSLATYRDRIVEAVQGASDISITDTLNNIMKETGYNTDINNAMREYTQTALMSMVPKYGNAERLTIVRDFMTSLDLIGALNRSGMSKEFLLTEFPLLEPHIKDTDGVVTVDPSTPIEAFLHISAMLPNKGKELRKFALDVAKGLVIKKPEDLLDRGDSSQKEKNRNEISDILNHFTEGDNVSTDMLPSFNTKNAAGVKFGRKNLKRLLRECVTPEMQELAKGFLDKYESETGKKAPNYRSALDKATSSKVGATSAFDSDNIDAIYMVSGLVNFATAAYIPTTSIQNAGFADIIEGLTATGMGAHEIKEVGRLASFGKASPIHRLANGKLFFSHEGTTYECTPEHKDFIKKEIDSILADGMHSGQALANTLITSGFLDGTNGQRTQVVFTPDVAAVDGVVDNTGDSTSAIRQVDKHIAVASRAINEIMESARDSSMKKEADGKPYLSISQKTNLSKLGPAIEKLRNERNNIANKVAIGVANALEHATDGPILGHNLSTLSTFAEHQTLRVIDDYLKYLDSTNATKQRYGETEVSLQQLGVSLESLSDISLLAQHVKGLAPGENINIPNIAGTDTPQVSVKLHDSDFDPMASAAYSEDRSTVPNLKGTLFYITDVNGKSVADGFIGKDERPSGSIDAFLMTARGTTLTVMTSETKFIKDGLDYGHFNAPDQFISTLGRISKRYRRVELTNTSNKCYVYGGKDVFQANSHTDALTFRASTKSYEDSGENSITLSGIPKMRDPTKARKDNPDFNASKSASNFNFGAIARKPKRTK